MFTDHLIGRRETLGGMVAAFTLAALAREARGAALAGETSVRRWIDAQQAIAEGLARGRLLGRQWSIEVERLAREIDVAELMRVVNRSQIRSAGAPFANDPHKRFVRFVDDQGQPRQLTYGAALFDFRPDNVVTPHGHHHMVSAHLVVAGKFRVRNFDRVGEEAGAMRLRPTRDYVARTGRVSTMCSERDNVHWFVPQDGPATTFDVVISGLDPGAPDHVIEAVDPLNARRQADGTLIAPIIGFAESSRRYTAAI